MNWIRGIVAMGGVVTMVAAVACSSSDDGKSGGQPGKLQTSVDGAKKLNELSDSDAVTYCKDARAFMQGSISETEQKGMRCNYKGIFAGRGEDTVDQAKKVCSDKRTPCLAESTPDAGPVDAGPSQPDACLVFKSKIAKCQNLTVVDSNACYEDIVNQWKVFAKEDACTSVAPNSTSDPVEARLSKDCDAWRECVLLNE